MTKRFRIPAIVLVLAMLCSMTLGALAQAIPTDGVYEGTANGLGGALKVAVTVDADKIVDIVLMPVIVVFAVIMTFFFGIKTGFRFDSDKKAKHYRQQTYINSFTSICRYCSAVKSQQESVMI